MSKSILISGTHSGVGKTTISFILMSLLRQMGYQVQPFKHGPDFIDPGYHRLATGRDSINLDFWMMGAEHIEESFNHYVQDADIAIVEAMGALFDGQNGTEKGSAAHLASLLHLPTVLVVDAYGMTRSVNALIQGFLSFDPLLKIMGVIFNKVGSRKHYEMIFESLSPSLRALSLGYLPQLPHAGIPERHLGLLTVEENDQMSKISETYLKTAVETLKPKLLLERIGSGKQHAPVSGLRNTHKPVLTSSHKVRLGIAKDMAFCFYYKQNLDFLKEAGAELVYFSPLEDSFLPENLDGIYFGGGYPENFAEKLQDNTTMKSQILNCAQKGMPIYAECGGLIYLCKQLLHEDGKIFSMVGIFPYTIKWTKNYLAIRYVEIKTTQNTLLGPKGLVIKGQEFHQTHLLNSSENLNGCYEVTSSTDEKFLEGFQINNTLASYIHLYFPSAPSVAHHFIAQSEKYQNWKRMIKPGGVFTKNTLDKIRAGQ